MAGKARTVVVPHRSALARVLRGRAYSKLIVALYRWRVGIGLLLRHQALHKLRQASQTHQQMITNLRKTAPRGSQRALQPLAHFSRISRALGLSCAIGQWKLFCAANATSAVLMTSSALSGNGTFTARARVKKASAQELALAEMRSECDSLRAEAVERERQLALVQKQLAAAVDRRRVVESDGRHAQELLARMQSEQGRVRAVRDGLVAAQEAEAEWRLEAARAFRERLIVVRELEHEERTAKWARELVLSCHGALLEAQRAQRRHASEMSAEKSRALMRMTEIQAAVAADACTLAAHLRKQVADKALREQAKKRGALAALGTTMTPATRCIAKCSGDSTKSIAKRSRFARENLSSGAAPNTNPDEADEITEEEGECGDNSECDEIPVQTTRAACATCSAPVIRASADCGRDTPATGPRASLNVTFRGDAWEPDQSRAALVGVSEKDLSEPSANRQWLMQLRQTLTRRQLELRRASALGTAWKIWISYCSAVINWEKLEAYSGQLESCRAEERRYKSLLVECRKKLAAEKNRADRLEASRSNEQLASRQLELQRVQDASYVPSTLEVQCLTSTNAFFDNSCESVARVLHESSC
ncbi:hypothetical protein AB1Y20_003763 [Prymnesium parvum]|uniref:Protein of centriole 5 n=1 Tax=Prymnesium parvum TaxID=97485 RepID=A0AB34J780_PRYPA